MIRVDVNVNDASALLALGSYGAGALLRVERAASEDGAYSEIGTVALTADSDHYTYWDTTGSTSSWYRTRVSNSANTVQSAYDTPTQATSIRAYADVEDLLEMMPRVSVERDRNVFWDILERASSVIDAKTGRDFYRHPQVEGEEVRLFDMRRSARRLIIPEGIVSASLVEYAIETGADFTEFADTDWWLRPIQAGADQPRWYLDISPASDVYGHFYYGPATVRVTGVFGFESVPRIIRAGTLALARSMAADILTPSGAPRGDFDAPNVLLPTETYTAVKWGQSVGPSGNWFA